MDMVIEGSISFDELSDAICFWDVEEDIENARWVREMTPHQKGEPQGSRNRDRRVRND